MAGVLNQLEKGQETNQHEKNYLRETSETRNVSVKLYDTQIAGGSDRRSTIPNNNRVSHNMFTQMLNTTFRVGAYSFETTESISICGMVFTVSMKVVTNEIFKSMVKPNIP